MMPSVDDALRGYLANYEAAWQAGEIDAYYLFPGSRIRMLGDTGRRWTRRVREHVKPLSRDGARVAFKEPAEIAGVEHRPGRGWYGLRRITADLAEMATTDDRVKDRPGGWQDSETRTHIYQDRETEQLRAAAADVRRQLRLAVDWISRRFSRRSRPSSGRHWRRTSRDQRIPRAGPEKESAGTREGPGAYNSRFTNSFTRTGDRTRRAADRGAQRRRSTGDVQLGKVTGLRTHGSE